MKTRICAGLLFAGLSLTAHTSFGQRFIIRSGGSAIPYNYNQPKPATTPTTTPAVSPAVPATPAEQIPDKVPKAKLAPANEAAPKRQQDDIVPSIPPAPVPEETQQPMPRSRDNSPGQTLQAPPNEPVQPVPTNTDPAVTGFTRTGSADGWSLERCIRFARDHSLTIQLNVLNQRLAALRLEQSRFALIPNVNASLQGGRSFGRSVDPTSNQFISTAYNFAGIGLNGDALLFGWFQKRNTIEQNRLNLRAASYDLAQVENDISLNVATGYLRSLQSKEQIYINQKQTELSKAQLSQTRSFAKAGRVPELNVAQLESQVATDSANLINAISQYQSSLLDLKALLNLEFVTPFDVLAPDISGVDNLKLANFDAEQIFESSYQTFPAITRDELRIQSSRKSLAVAEGARLPSLGISLQTNSNFASTLRDITGYSVAGAQQTGSYISVDGTQYPVFQPVVNVQTQNTPFFTQIGNNFRQTVAFTVTAPLFNGYVAQYNVKAAKVNVQSQQLNKAQTELSLKQNIYKAVNEARNSTQRFNAAKRASYAASRALDFAKQRYDLGLTSTVDYLIIQNNQFAADAALLNAKYELLFRLKVIDYYLGKELTL